jgi:hypothetical protein
VGAPSEGGERDGVMQVRRCCDHDDLGMRLGQHVLPFLEDPRHAVLVRDGAGGRLVALTYRHDLRAIGLKRRDMRPAEAEADDAHRGDALGHRSLRLLSDRDRGPEGRGCYRTTLPFHRRLG